MGNAICEDCYWHHEGKKNDCFFEHEPSKMCGDYEDIAISSCDRCLTKDMLCTDENGKIVNTCDICPMLAR